MNGEVGRGKRGRITWRRCLWVLLGGYSGEKEECGVGTERESGVWGIEWMESRARLVR